MPKLPLLIKLNKQQKGVTLIELLLVISIITILSIATVPMASGFLVRNYLRNSRDELISLLSSAKTNSIANKANSSWGVNVTGTIMTLFKGSNFTTRDPVFDQVFTLPNSIAVTNDEVVFSQHTGNADAIANFSVTSNSGDSDVININEVGNIDVN